MRNVLSIGIWLVGAAAFSADVPIQVTGSRVNLRARPDANAEVVGQADFNQALVAKSVQDEWVEVYPPPGSFGWIHRDYVVDGRVSAKLLNIRSGSGISYSIVGRLVRNTPIVPREEFGEWIKIDAPAVCSFWIHREYVKSSSGPLSLGEEEAPAPAVVTGDSQMEAEEPALAAEPEPSPLFAEEDEALLAGLELIPLDGQGKPVEVEGVLRHTDFLIGRPSNFRLVKVYRNGLETICYVRGEPDEMKKMFNKYVHITGREYWAHKVGYPVVVPETMTLDENPPPPGD